MAAPGGGSAVRTAAEFFGATDPDAAADKFKTVAFRALHDQKIEEELTQTKQENDRLRNEAAALGKQAADLRLSLEINIEDRERVLAFKSKRIEELHGRVRDLEAINASLLETINGGRTAAPPPGVGEEVTGEQARAARMSLLNAGKPLFHALDTCKEQDFKRLYDEKRAQCDSLLAQMTRDAALVEEARVFQAQKLDFESRVAQLETMLTSEVANKEEMTLRMERKLLFENERMRKEKESELLACQQSMEKHMLKQLDVTTQRTVEENERVQIELRFQSSQLEKFIKRMDQLATENRQLLQEKGLFEDMNATLSKKLKFYEQLFTKMQQREEQQQRGSSNQHSSTGESPNPRVCRGVPHKPPLPSLAIPTASSPGTVDAGSPKSYFDDDVAGYSGQGAEPASLDRATDMLEKHLLGREFNRKQLAAALEFHHELFQQQKSKLSGASPVSNPSPVFARKKIMLPKSNYHPSSYHTGRKIRQAPMTLDALIRQKAAAPPPMSRPTAVDQQEDSSAGLAARTVPAASALKAPVAPNDMWKASTAPSPHIRAPASPPMTARF